MTLQFKALVLLLTNTRFNLKLGTWNIEDKDKEGVRGMHPILAIED